MNEKNLIAQARAAAPAEAHFIGTLDNSSEGADGIEWKDFEPGLYYVYDRPIRAAAPAATAPGIKTWQERMQTTNLTWKTGEGKAAAEHQYMIEEIAELRAALSQQPVQAAGEGDDQQWDREAERLTLAAGIGGGRINMNATSVLDIFEDDDAAPVIAAPTALKIAEMIHYPQCWDTAAYPTVESALREIAAFKCAECSLGAPTATSEPAATNLQKDLDSIADAVTATTEQDKSQPCRNVLMRVGYKAVPKSCPRCGLAKECPAGHAPSVRDHAAMAATKEKKQ